MLVLLRIAFRNFWLNISKRLILMLIVIAAISLLLIGNLFLAQSDKTMQLVYRDSFAGELVIAAQDQDPFNLFGSAVPLIGEQLDIPWIVQDKAIVEILEQEKDIIGVMPQITKLVRLERDQISWHAPVFGLDLQKYAQFFPGLKLIKGTMPITGSNGLVFSTASLEACQKVLGKELVLGDEITVTVKTATSFSIRNFYYAALIELPGRDLASDRIIWADLGDVQDLAGLRSDNDGEILLNDYEQDLVNSSLDDLLSDTEAISTEESAEAAVNKELDSGINFLVLRLAHADHADALSARLSQEFATKKIAAQVLSWRQAAGGFAPTVAVVQVIFNIGILFIVLVSCLVIMNSVTLSTMDRTKEIGTMRALGASKAKIALIISFELMIMMVIAGFLAAVLGCLVITMVNSLELRTSNQVIVALLGIGPVVIRIDPALVLWHFLLTIGLGFIALLNPLRLALAVQPIQAIQRD